MELEPRTVRRALLRAALGALVAASPSLLAGRLLAIPPSIALVAAPVTLLEDWLARQTSLVISFVSTTVVALAMLNGIYLDGLVRGASIRAGLEALMALLDAPSDVAALLVVCQAISITFMLAHGWKTLKEEAKAILLTMLFIVIEAVVAIACTERSVPEIVLVVSGPLWLATLLAGGALSLVYLTADRIERALWPPARPDGSSPRGLSSRPLP